MVFQYSQSWVIKLCYKPYTKGENKDSHPLNFKRPCLNTRQSSLQYTTQFSVFQTLVKTVCHETESTSSIGPII